LSTCIVKFAALAYLPHASLCLGHVSTVTLGVQSSPVVCTAACRWFSRVVGKAVSNYTRKQLVSKVFSTVFTKGGPTLTGGLKA